MTVELLQAAQQKNPDALNQVWQDVKPWARIVARRYENIAKQNGAFDREDLDQLAAVGFMQAIKTYKPEQGSFLTWVKWYIKITCRISLGLHGRIRKEHYNKISLSEPIGDNESGLTLEDTIADETQPTDDEITERAATIAVVHAALDTLKAREKECINAIYFQGKTAHDIATALGVTDQAVSQTKREALAKLKRSRYIETLMIMPDAYYKLGVGEFKTCGWSIEQKIAILHENRGI